MDSDARSAGPLYYEMDPWKKILLRAWFVVTFLTVVIAVILGLIKAKDDAVLYLLIVNLLVSGIIGTTIAWWFHKGIIRPQSLVFIFFLGICIIFQAVVSDIYLYHNPKSSGDSTPENNIHNATTISPSMSSPYNGTF